MEGRREEDGERPLEPRDWEQTRGAEQQEEHAPSQATRPHEQPTEPREQPTEPREQPTEPRDQPTEPREQAAQPQEQPTAETREEAIHDQPGGPGSPEAMREGAPDDTAPAAAPARPRDTGEMTAERGSQEEADEYQWHTGRRREHGSEDAVEFIDVVKAFGRNRVLNGLNLGLPDSQISMILGPSGTGKSVCIKHMVGLLYPDEGDVLVHGESVPKMSDD